MKNNCIIEKLTGRDFLNFNIEFRNCEYSDTDYILKLKELCIKWYIEIIYGWCICIYGF